MMWANVIQQNTEQAAGLGRRGPAWGHGGGRIPTIPGRGATTFTSAPARDTEEGGRGGGGLTAVHHGPLGAVPRRVGVGRGGGGWPVPRPCCYFLQVNWSCEALNDNARVSAGRGRVLWVVG
ncbi:unnamed protein product, partial [Gadus morhua 'NCC']